MKLAFVSSFTGTKLGGHFVAPPKHNAPCNTLMVLSKRQRRLSIIKSKNFHRNGFGGTRELAEEVMNREFTSEIVKEMNLQGNLLSRGTVSFRLADAYGFCWGVERAISMAYETRKMFPTKRIWITNEIIHNPIVNERMEEMDIFFIGQKGALKDFSGVQKGDVVILPAFGATLEEMQYLHDLKCEIVDTTCPWVSRVWKALDRHKQKACTSIIHGKWKHEETVATASFADKYLVVLNMDEANYVVNYILNGGDREDFLLKFKNAYSEGFDPDKDLEAIGVANQTTMLKSETAAMGKLFEKTMMKKYGTVDLGMHFVAYDTICNATQERQDAIFKILEKKSELDMFLVVGGFNSSNTSHLQEIAEHAGVASYWVDRPDCIGPGNKILYRTSDGKEHTLKDWIPNHPITIGITSGASTPDMVVEDVIERVFMISKLQTAAASRK